MSDLFDLPFEEDDDVDSPPSTVDSRQASTVRQSAAVDSTRHRPVDDAGSRPSTAADRRSTDAPTTVDADVATRRVLSVTELNVRIRDLLEAEFFEVWVEGELSNCRVWNTGHLYFTLKDAGAQVRGVIFRSALRYLKFKPADGLRVVARGRISVYEPKGEYQLVCEHMEPHGLGALQLAFDQLKKRLQAEGLFDAGAQAAAARAAAQDRHRHLARRRGDSRHHQGAAAAATRTPIWSFARRACRARAPRSRSRAGSRRSAALPGVDVVIVGRGGGSIEDLWAFNEEVVARAIAGSPVPIISAVGHETDVTIADFVADVRAPTPSAAAELVVAAQG